MIQTYKFYDKKGRRLSIFGTQEGNGLKIHVFTCSKEDKFDKQRANLIFQYYKAKGPDETDIETPEEYISHPKIFTIAVENGMSNKAFINWCEANYERRISTFLHMGMVEGSSITGVKFNKNGVTLEYKVKA